MWQALIGDFTAFMDRAMAFVDELDINIDNLLMDHVAIRMKNVNDVQVLEHELDQVGNKIADAIVNGRKICIFKLHDPLIYKNKAIDCIELPYPSIDHHYPQDGWEHVEFVLDGANPLTLESEFAKKYPSLSSSIRNKYKYRISTPDVKNEELVNTTIVLQKNASLAIKFHCYPIEEVVKNNR